MSATDMDGGERESAFEIMLKYMEVSMDNRNAMQVRSDNEHLMRLQKICDFRERQKSDLVELRRCIHYIKQHTNVIQGALQQAQSDDAAVPISSALTKDIVAVKKHMQESIRNAHNIKLLLGIEYEPLMDNMLSKMELQLNNWTTMVNVASKTLANSKALHDNIQNLIASQQQLCSDVTESALFSALDGTLDPEKADNNTTNSDQLSYSFKCSTPF